MSDLLEFIAAGGPQVHFRGLYRWIDLKEFRIAGAAGPRDLLLALLAHNQYRDTYISAHTDAGQHPVHGPYRLEEISPESFDQIDAAAAHHLLRGWIDMYGTPEMVEGDLEAVLERVATSSTIFRLQDLGERAWHDVGWINDDFTELVLISEADSTLTLLVAAGD